MYKKSSYVLSYTRSFDSFRMGGKRLWGLLKHACGAETTILRIIVRLVKPLLLRRLLGDLRHIDAGYARVFEPTQILRLIPNPRRSIRKRYKFYKFGMRDAKTCIVNTAKQIGDLVDRMILHHAPPAPSKPSMYIDLEGVNLCRDGSLSIFTLLIDTGTPTMNVYLIDVHSLGSQAFNTAGIKRKTLKNILQDETISKVFFDVRNDSDALFSHFGVALKGVEDIQLMESATRKTTSSRKYVTGLAKCVA